MRLLRIAAFLVLALSAFAAEAYPVITKYKSPKNAERRVRKNTTLIVLHTTEAPAKGSLRKLSERGECHYCVTEDGSVYQIMDRNKVAFHSGTSMWNGKSEVDDFSIGIECVGYHDKSMPLVQLRAIRDLVKELKKVYNVSDDRVVTHSQVAYAEPNKWQKKKCRGRKRCGMLFAMPSVRKILELKTRAAYDPDVKAKRLVVADKELAAVLYGKTDTMKKVYGSAKISEVAPTSAPAPKPKPKTPEKPSSAFKALPQSVAELKKQGFVPIGTVTKKNLPLNIAGDKWNSPDTYYSIRNKVIPGNILKPNRVEAGMNVWRRK